MHSNLAQSSAVLTDDLFYSRHLGFPLAVIKLKLNLKQSDSSNGLPC